MPNLLLCAFMLLGMQEPATPGREAPPVHRYTFGFASSVLPLPDMDGDGVAELVVADRSFEYGGEGLWPQLLLYSPGMQQGLGSFSLGGVMRVGWEADSLAALSHPTAREQEIAVLALERIKGVTRYYILVLSVSSMRVTSKIPLPELPESARRVSMWSLGAGSGELLVRCGSRAFVVNIASGKCEVPMRLQSGSPSPIGDLDNDGVIDCVVTNGGVHRVYSLGTREVLFSFSERRGERLSRSWLRFFPGADVDGDGKPEFVMAIQTELGIGEEFQYESKLSLRSGATGRALFGLGHFRTESGRGISVNVLACPDQDDDGVPDLVVAVCDDNWSCSKWMVTSGVDGKVIAEHKWTVNGRFNDIGTRWGRAMANVGDLNEDGIGDFVISRSWPGGRRSNAGAGVLLLCTSEAGQLVTVTREDVMPEEYSK